MTWFSAAPESAKRRAAAVEATPLSTQRKPETFNDVGAAMRAIGLAAREATSTLAQASSEAKSAALIAAGREIRGQTAAILLANERDLREARDADVSAAFLDRLLLDPQRIEAVATGLEAVADLADPVGAVLARWTRPNGLLIERVRVPLGVVGIIYESRPNVTADAGGLCLKSGNAAILRGGSDSHHSSRAIQICLARG